MTAETPKPQKDLDGLQIATRILVWMLAIGPASWWVSSVLAALLWPGDVAMYAGISPWSPRPLGVGLGALALATYSGFAVREATASASKHWKRILVALGLSVAYVGLFAAFLFTPLGQSSSAYIAIAPFLFAFPFYAILGAVILYLAAQVWADRQARSLPDPPSTTSIPGQ